jgi:phosphatidylglycerol---prolipoprotein diacylglyceryl transferase
LRVNSHNQLVSAYFPGVRVHPAPVYETILYTLVFLVLLRLERKNRPIGQLFYIYLVLVGICRFMVEFIRVNPRVLFGLSEAQLIALIIVVIGLAAYTWSRTTKQPVTALEAA